MIGHRPDLISTQGLSEAKVEKIKVNRDADEMDSIDEYYLGRRRKNNCSYLMGMDPLQGLTRYRGLRSLPALRFQTNENVC